MHSLYRIWDSESGQERRHVDLCLLRLLLGRDIATPEYSNGAMQRFLLEFRKSLKCVMRDPVLTLLGNNGPVNMASSSEYKWVSIDKGKCEGDVINFGVDLLRDYFVSIGAEYADPEPRGKAQFTAVDSYGGQTRSFAYHSVSPGNAVSVVVKEHTPHLPVLVVVDDGDLHTVPSVSVIMTVFAVFQVSDEVWGIGKEMKRTGPGFSCRHADWQLFRFSSGVRRVGLVHICENACVRRGHGGRDMVHSQSVMDGGTYSVLSRKDGYPPHMG